MLADVLSRLEKQEAGDVDAARAGVEAVFDISWQSLDPTIQQLGCLLSVFAPAPISQTLLAQVIEAVGVPIPEDAIASGCNTLIQRYLLQRIDQQTYTLHDLIRELFQAKLDQLPQADDLKRGFCQVMVLLSQDVPQPPNLTEIAKVAPAIPHIAEAATTLKAWLVDEDLIWPFVGLGRFYEGQGAYDQAAPWQEQCLAATRDRFGEEHPSVALSLNNLAYLYRSQGRYSEAEPLYVEALAMKKRLLGEEHPSVALSLNNLAGLYDSQGRYSEAEPLYVEALAMRKRLLGEEHPSVALSLNNLAYLYRSQGRYSEAEPLYREALEMRQRLLGEEHPNTITTRENLEDLRRRMTDQPSE